MAYELYCCLLPQCEALRTCSSGFPIATIHYSYTYKMYLKGIKACCTLAFATVLAIRSKISEEQCLKRNSDLVRSRTVLLIRLEVTTHVPRSDSNKKLNDDHISKRSLWITCT